jgi:hypothetical protein
LPGLESLREHLFNRHETRIVELEVVTVAPVLVLLTVLLRDLVPELRQRIAKPRTRFTLLADVTVIMTTGTS